MLSRGHSADERAERKVGRRVDVKEGVGLQGGSGYKWVRKSSRRMPRCRHWRRCRETAAPVGRIKPRVGARVEETDRQQQRRGQAGRKGGGKGEGPSRGGGEPL